MSLTPAPTSVLPLAEALLNLVVPISRRSVHERKPPMSTHQPLAARMRPTTLDEVVGQNHLIFPGSPLKAIVEGQLQASVLLWGPLARAKPPSPT